VKIRFVYSRSWDWTQWSDFCRVATDISPDAALRSGRSAALGRAAALGRLQPFDSIRLCAHGAHSGGDVRLPGIEITLPLRQTCYGSLQRLIAVSPASFVTLIAPQQRHFLLV